MITEMPVRNVATAALGLFIPSAEASAEGPPLVLHVKTALSVDDAQICVVPNVAWAALAEGRPVTVVFDGSAASGWSTRCSV